MIWTSLFIINIAQGLFLISVLIYRNSKNPLASRLISAMIAIMIITNLGYLVIRTELLNYIPHLYLIQFGTTFLFGPLFYFYVKSVIDNVFKWKHEFWLHFIPYLMQVIFNIPFYAIEKIYVIEFINIFLAGNLIITTEAKIIFAIQITHLFIYLFITFRRINSINNNFGSVRYIIPILSRLKWLKELFYCFSLIAFALLGLYVFVMLKGKFDPVTNYTNTLITSGIIYFISYKLVFNPELLNPDFTLKYRAYKQFEGKDGEKYIQKLKSLMDVNKFFINPDLKLSLLAEQLGLPPHQVSKLINEKLGKSFNDFINEYRVNEFISRLNCAEYRSYSIYGIALDVGFNSKSSFNTAFKKITGKIPSEYKNPP